MDAFSDEEEWAAGDEDAATSREWSRMSENYSNASSSVFFVSVGSNYTLQGRLDIAKV